MLHAGNVEKFGFKSFLCKTTVENIQDVPSAKITCTCHEHKSDLPGLGDFFRRCLKRSVGLPGSAEPGSCIHGRNLLIEVRAAVLDRAVEYVGLIEAELSSNAGSSRISGYINSTRVDSITLHHL